MTHGEALDDARDIMELWWSPVVGVCREVAMRTRFTYEEADERIYAAVVDAVAGMIEGR